MRRIVIGLCAAVLMWRVGSPYLPEMGLVASQSETLTDQCCDDLASRLKRFQRDGASKLAAGEFKAATDFEAWSSAGWLLAEREAFRPLDDAESHAVFASDWRAAFQKLWKDWGGDE